MKTKIILKSNTIVFDPFNLFVFVNICLLVLFKKFNMDITEKMVSFQIIQNVINVKTTLVYDSEKTGPTEAPKPTDQASGMRPILRMPPKYTD